jgi:hypothetical protein
MQEREPLSLQRLVGTILALEAGAFASAALLHSGALVASHHHAEAAIAETVIALVLFGGAAVAMLAPGRSRAAGLAAQGFALAGTLVGIFTIAVGIGPRSPLDYALHAGFVAALITGLVLVARRGTVERPQRERAEHRRARHPRGTDGPMRPR